MGHPGTSYLSNTKTAYSEPAVSLTFYPAARRMLPATIAAFLLALLVTQTASFVCSAQCIQHQLGRPSTTTHCHSMQQSEANRATVGTCPAYSLCVNDLLANSQNKSATKPLSTFAELRPAALLSPLPLVSCAPVTPTRRSSIGDPPLITPLRI